VEKVEKPEAEWKKQLSAQQFEIARQAGTERPGTGKYAHNHYDGLYSCFQRSRVVARAWVSPFEPSLPAEEPASTELAERSHILRTLEQTEGLMELQLG
jgi:hypothetical protein